MQLANAHLSACVKHAPTAVTVRVDDIALDCEFVNQILLYYMPDLKSMPNNLILTLNQNR